MVLASYSTTTYATAGMSTDLSRFRGTSDGYMDTIHATRDSTAADVAVLVSNDAAPAAWPRASVRPPAPRSPPRTGTASPATTASPTKSATCSRRATIPPPTRPTRPYAYGHGYRAPNNAWRTIMAYNCPAPAARASTTGPTRTCPTAAWPWAPRPEPQPARAGEHQGDDRGYRGAPTSPRPRTSPSPPATSPPTSPTPPPMPTAPSPRAPGTSATAATSTATNPSRTYAAAGTYTVTLTVTDNVALTNTKTSTVTVADHASRPTATPPTTR